MRTILSLIMLLAGGGAACAAELDCEALPGAAAILASQPRFVLMGEAHGTAQLPKAFEGLVCAAAKAGPVTVGLEFLPAEQDRLEAYLSSDGGEAAKEALLQGEGWADPHGRASQAIFDLVEQLRTLKAKGADLAVVAFDHAAEQPGTSMARERAMAELLMAAHARRPGATLVALTGAGHAGKSAWTSFGPPFPAMSQLLPDAQTIAITFERPGGQVWACRAPQEGEDPVCKAWDLTARDPVAPRAVRLDKAREGYEAIVSPGSPFSASPPARQILHGG